MNLRRKIGRKEKLRDRTKRRPEEFETRNLKVNRHGRSFYGRYLPLR